MAYFQKKAIYSNHTQHFSVSLDKQSPPQITKENNLYLRYGFGVFFVFNCKALFRNLLIC